MKTSIKKTKNMVVLFAFFLLGTVGISAQNYQDDVYYSPSKDTSKKAEKPKSVKKEVKETYRSINKTEDFSTAQEKYAKMLRDKQEDANYAKKSYNGKVAWVQNTQGLKPKQEIKQEISLYSRGNVNADNPSPTACYDEDYILWQPTKVTKVYIEPNLYSNFYFRLNFGWGRAYYSTIYYPYYTNYYDPFYWSYYNNPYWGNAYYGYSPWHYPHWIYPHYSVWRHNYYSPYYDYDNYLHNRYYRNNYKYSQRPREYSKRDINSRRHTTMSTRRISNNSNAKDQRVRVENMNKRYSGIANRTNSDNSRFRTSSSPQNTRLVNDKKNSNVIRNTRNQNNRINNSVKYRTSRNTIHQDKAPYVRRIKRSSTEFRNNKMTPRHSVTRRSIPQEYRRMNSNRNVHRSSPTTYRKTTNNVRRYRNTSVHTNTSKNTNTYRTTPSRRRSSVNRSSTRNSSVRSSSIRSTRTSIPRTATIRDRR